MTTFDKKYQSNFDAALFGLTLDRGAKTPLHIQLVEALRDLILSGDDVAGLRVPSGRNLAVELSVSRMTITTAYDQLLGEGYLVARKGSGTFVADHLRHLVSPPVRRAHAAPEPKPWLPFQPGLPDPSLFPHRVWARHLERAWRDPAPGLLAQPDAFGWYPLRQAICDHLSVWRGLTCNPEQVLITGGASEAIDIICHAILKRGDVAAVEDPGWHPLRSVLAKSGLHQRPHRIDAQGLNAAQLTGGVSAVFVTPSRHFPTGTVMPLARRLDLLEWAAQNAALIVEDDYDSEFRYRGQPSPALAGLDGLKTTIYLGSFSKLLNPALRIGYLVLPEAHIPAIRAYVLQSGTRASLVPQPALAEFMQSGDFATHLRRMRRTYAKRQASLVLALEGAGEVLDIQSDPSGMHLCCGLRREALSHTSDADISRRAAERGLCVRALSSHAVLPDPPQALLLGYAAFDEETLARAAQGLAEVLHEFG